MALPRDVDGLGEDAGRPGPGREAVVACRVSTLDVGAGLKVAALIPSEGRSVRWRRRSRGGPGLRLPQNSLNGNVQPLLFNLGAPTRPLPPLTLSARYRYYEMFDVSDELMFVRLVQNDRSLLGTRRPGRCDLAKQNADVDARWKFGEPVALTAGAGWERWDRNEHRRGRMGRGKARAGRAPAPAQG